LQPFLLLDRTFLFALTLGALPFDLFRVPPLGLRSRRAARPRRSRRRSWPRRPAPPAIPMAVTWRLQHRLPGDLFASFAAAVAY
jgi:hypothetical protein